MQPAHQPGYLLQHVATLLARQSDQVLQEQLGIGLSQFKILRILQANPHLRQRDIAGNLGQTEASVSRQVKLMLEQGLLQTIVSSRDRREHLTMPTRKGLRLTEAALQGLGKYLAPTFAALGDKQQAQLAAHLEALHAQLCAGIHTEHPSREN